MDTVLSCELNGAVEVDLSGRLELTFVTDEVNTDILSSMLLDLLQPAAQVLESLIASDIVSEEDTVGSTVENSSHRLERLLTSLQ